MHFETRISLDPNSLQYQLAITSRIKVIRIILSE